MTPLTRAHAVPARAPSHRAERRALPRRRLRVGLGASVLTLSVVSLGVLTMRSVEVTHSADVAYAEDAPAPVVAAPGLVDGPPGSEELEEPPPPTDLSDPASAPAPAQPGPVEDDRAVPVSRLVPVGPPAPDRATARLLDRRVAARQRALAALERQAASWSRVLADRSATLSELGYAGDPSAVSVVLPLASYRLSAPFGAAGDLWARDHTGQDFGAASGTPLHAVADAEVVSVGDAGAYGLRTVFELPDGTQIWYCHQLTALVATGESVEVAETVGLVGSTGNSTGPHLHLEVRDPGGVPLDPSAWLRAHGVTP